MAKWPADIQKEICDYLNNEHPEWVMLFVKKLADQPDAAGPRAGGGAGAGAAAHERRARGGIA